MIILTGARKALDKLQQPFRIKILNNAGIKEIYLNVIKAIQDKHSYHHPQWWKAESTPSQVRSKRRMVAPATSVQHRPAKKSQPQQVSQKKEEKASELDTGRTASVCTWQNTHIMESSSTKATRTNTWIPQSRSMYFFFLTEKDRKVFKFLRAFYFKRLPFSLFTNK